MSNTRTEAHGEAFGGSRILLVAATEMEARASLHSSCLPEAIRLWQRMEFTPTCDLVITGVGKANAAGAVARTADPARHSLILNIGIAGALPTTPALSLCSVVWAAWTGFADEGAATPSGFSDIAQMGFPPMTGPRWEGSRYRVHDHVLALGASLGLTTVGITTVSTCSGTDALAAEIAHRTGASAEAMEGAAVALAADRLGIPFAELRAISNTTGDRDKQIWQIKPALAALTDVLGRLLTTPTR